jgi:hypothetical protein
MPVKPQEVAGNKLTEKDKEYLTAWLNWIDDQLVKFRYEEKEPEPDGSYKIKLSAKIRVSVPIIRALVYLYEKRAWKVQHVKESKNKGKLYNHFLIFSAPSAEQMELLDSLEHRRRFIRRDCDYKNGFVYLLKGENGLYKIGRSKTPEIRISTITKAIAPFDIQTINTAFYPDCYKAESDLHKLFANKRVRGEWFELGDDDVMTIITHPYKAL